MKSFFLFPYLIKLNQTPCFPTVTVWRNISTLAEWKCESGQRRNDLACCQTRTWSGVDSKNEEKFHCFGWWLLIGHRGLTYSFCVIDQVYSTTVLTCSSDDIYSEEPIFINVYVGWRIDFWPSIYAWLRSWKRYAIFSYFRWEYSCYCCAMRLQWRMCFLTVV